MKSVAHSTEEVNPALAAQYTSEAAEFETQAQADDARVQELLDTENAFLSDYYELRRNWNEYLAANARESADYFSEVL